MGLFDAFSSDDETRKFEQGLNYQTRQINQADSKIDRNFLYARDALQEGQQQGLGYLEDQYGTARGDISDAQRQGQDYLSGAADRSGRTYDQALTPWQQLSGMGQQGVQSYGDLIGLGGGDPAKMQAMLAATPGYQWQMDQGLEGLNRTANSRGMLTSGNNTQDILKYSQGLADQSYQSAVQNRMPYFGMLQNAAQGQSNVLGQKAGMYDQLGRSQAGLSQWGGGQLSNLADQYGINQSNLATGTASALAGNRQTQGTLGNANRLAQGQAGADNYMNQANAQSAADSNMWGAILGTLGAASGGLGNYVGAGGRF
jgi:hypothetical protein